MAGEWIGTTIGEQATLQRGIDITKADQRPGQVPVISSGGVSSYHDAAAASGPGVVLGRKGVVGSVYFIPSDYWPHDTTLWVKDFHGNDPRFVYYFFKWMAPRIATMDVGSANPTLNRNHVHPIEIRWPPPPEQRAIAHILGTLDDKIELNRRMSETLEAMARALFRSWFVDFDPVRRNIARRERGQPSPAASRHPLSEGEGSHPSKFPSTFGRGAGGEGRVDSLDALFPDRLVDSELGEIPDGWEVGRFGDVVEQLRDQENPLSYPDVLFNHFSIPAFDEGQTAKAEFGESIKSLKSRVPPGVILMSKLNPEIERVWLIDVRPEDRAVCSTEFLVLQARSPFTRGYAYCLARSPLFRRQIEGLVTGTSKSHQRAQVESILNLAAVKPPARVVATFDRSIGGLLARTLECRREASSLAALRDTLLPKLISGELKIGRDLRSSGAR